MIKQVYDFLGAAIRHVIEKTEPDPPNFRGIPTSACPVCGNNWFQMAVAFDDEYTIEAYVLEAECDTCGALVTAPTPQDLNVD